MQTFRIAALVALCAAMPARAALAPDTNIEAELVKWVIKPCHHIVAATTVSLLDEEEAVNASLDSLTEGIMLIRHETVSQMKDIFLPQVQDAQWDERRLSYRTMLKACTSVQLSNIE